MFLWPIASTEELDKVHTHIPKFTTLDNGQIIDHPWYLAGGGDEYYPYVLEAIKNHGKPHYSQAFEWCVGHGRIGWEIITRNICDQWAFNDYYDLAIETCLKNSKKDQAENVMIVDLLRNDLSIYANTGSVKTTKLFEIESFNQVHHMVSEIVATLKDDINPMQMLLTALPGGSITGAPKIRAMQIIEERTVGPSMGEENIKRGVHSTLWGFAAISIMMIIYYMIFGGVSIFALAVNLLLLVALLSILQATLTLPGLAAIALALGMAIDANVLINERIREELRNGNTPQASIHAGYDRAFDTILDSNVTTLIAGLALFMFGTGPIKGFAVVHVLGILTSMFSAILVSRALVNIIYGYRRKIDKLSIGQIYRPHQD